MKVKAFTLIELVVTMCVSGIIIAMGSLGFEYAVKHFSLYKKNSEMIGEANSLYTLLSRDTDQGNIIKKAGESSIEILNQNGSIIKYSFYDSYVIRTKAEQTDSFRTPVKNVNFKLKRNLNESQIDIVELISFQSEPVSPFPFYIDKVYDAKTLIDLSNETIILEDGGN